METKISNIPVRSHQLIHRGQVVATGAMIAPKLGRLKYSLRKILTTIEILMSRGSLFSLKGVELKQFKNYIENFDVVQIDKRTPQLYLWTEKGARTCTIFVVHGE